MVLRLYDRDRGERYLAVKVQTELENTVLQRTDLNNVSVSRCDSKIVRSSQSGNALNISSGKASIRGLIL